MHRIDDQPIFARLAGPVYDDGMPWEEENVKEKENLIRIFRSDSRRCAKSKTIDRVFNRTSLNSPKTQIRTVGHHVGDVFPCSSIAETRVFLAVFQIGPVLKICVWFSRKSKSKPVTRSSRGD